MADKQNLENSNKLARGEKGWAQQKRDAVVEGLVDSVCAQNWIMGLVCKLGKFRSHFRTLEAKLRRVNWELNVFFGLILAVNAIFLIE